MKTLVFCSPLLYVITVVGQNSVAQDESKQTIGPPAVFAHVSRVLAELELIRFHMGRPKPAEPEFSVSDVEPRAVFFQAQTLFRKANRLSYEQTRERMDEPPDPGGQIQPSDVYEIVDAALDRIRRVKNELKIEASIPDPEIDLQKTPTDVIALIVVANRQLNLLLEKRFSPSDVYRQVTLAISYSARLLEQFRDSERIPTAPDLMHGKQPPDVYRRLLVCFDLLQSIAEHSDLKVIRLQVDDTRVEDVSPSDVYDIASLIVSELDYVHSQLKNAEPPRKSYFAGRKFPSHVFQRVGILEAQLQQLKLKSGEHATWLKKQKQ